MSEEADYRMADDRSVAYVATTVDGQQHNWTGTAQLLNRTVTVRSGPMILLCDDNTILNFAHVVSLTPTSGDTPDQATGHSP